MQQLIRILQDKRTSTYLKFGFWLYVVFLFVVTMMPMDDFENLEDGWLQNLSFENADKVIHVFLFFFLAVCLYFAYRLSLVWNFIIPVFIGILIEFLQKYFTENRTFDPWDIVGDSLGTLLAILILQFFIKPLQE